MKSILFSAALILGLLTSLNAQDFHLPVSTSSETAKQAYHAASYLASNAHIGAARVEIKKATEADPNFFMAHVYDYMLASDEQKSAALDKALAINPSGFTEAEKIMRRQMQAWKEDPKAKTARAMKELTTAYPNTPQAYEVAYLNALFTDGDKDAGLEYAKKLIALSPDFGPVYNGLGYIYMGKKEMDKAKAAFERYIELAPAEANAYDSMGEYYDISGDYAKAAEYYNRAVALGMEGSKSRAEKARLRAAEKN